MRWVRVSSFDPVAVVARLAEWDVIYPHDPYIEPPKHKMWVCMSKAELWFLRISTRRYKADCVPLPKSLNPFLEHDSFIGCGGDLIAEVEPSLEGLLGRQLMVERQGIVGQVDHLPRIEVCRVLQASEVRTPRQIEVMTHALRCSPAR